MSKTGMGTSVARKDAIRKVTGQALFAADIVKPGMLYAKVLRSKVPHAILESIDTSAAEAYPGVVKVLTAADIPGAGGVGTMLKGEACSDRDGCMPLFKASGVGIIIKDEPVLVNDKIRRIGDAIALVAAETEQAADAALKLIQVQLKELPAVFDPIEAMKPGAPQVHANNILTLRKIRKGDVDAAFANADLIIENQYKTQSVEHAYIEPEAGVAEYDGHMLTMWVATQNVHFDRKEVARTMNMDANRVRIVQAVTGGGFGGKLDISVQCHLALLAYHTRRPVKLVYTREESMAASAKRHPYIIDYKTAMTKDGKWTALKATIIADTGAYASYGPGVVTRAAVHATGPYEVPNVWVDAYGVYTNNPMAGAMRGFGVPQVAFAHESLLDQAAEKLGMSPLEIRLKNVLVPGGVTATGQVLKHSVGIKETILKAAEAAQQQGSNFSKWGVEA